MAGENNIKLIQLKDKDDNPVTPITSWESVVDRSGQTLQQWWEGILETINNKIDKTSIANALNIDDITQVLSAARGKELYDMMQVGSLFMGVADKTTTAPEVSSPMYFVCTQTGEYPNFKVTKANEGLSIIKSKNTNGVISWELVDLMPIAQELGESESMVVSQNAITQEFSKTSIVNGSEVKFLQGGLDGSVGGLVKEINSAVRVRTMLLKTPCSLKLKDGFNIRTAFVLNKDGAVERIEYPFTNESTIEDGYYVRFAIHKGNGSLNILPTEDILDYVICDKGFFINDIKIQESNFSKSLKYGTELDLEQGGFSIPEVGNPIDYTNDKTRVRTKLLKTPFQLEVNEDYNIVGLHILDKKQNYLKILNYSDGSKISYASEEDGYYAIAVIGKGNSNNIEFTPNEDIVKYYSLEKLNYHKEISKSIEWTNCGIYTVDGEDINNANGGLYRSNFLERKSTMSISSKMPSGYRLYVFQYDKDIKYISVIKLDNLGKLDITKLSQKCSYFRLEVIASHESEYFNINTLDFSVVLNSYDLNSAEEIKIPYKDKICKVVFKYKGLKNSSISITNTNEPNPIKLSDEWLYSKGIVKLPKNYSAKGEKTRLIIFAHSSSGIIVSDDFHEPYRPYIDYLVKEGYAVADCCNYGTIDGNMQSVSASQFWGTPSNYATYNAFYHYIIEHFNLRTDGCFLFGKSQGGIQVYGIPQCTSIPVIARCSLAGCYTPITLLFGTFNGDRYRCLKDFGFDGLGTLEEFENATPTGGGECMSKNFYNDHRKDYVWTLERKAYFLRNIDKVKGYVFPFTNELNVKDEDWFKASTLEATYDEWKALNPCITNQIPTIFFGAKDDYQLTDENERAHLALQNGGNITQIRYMPNGAADPHHSVDTDGVMLTITTKLGDVVENVPLAYAEMLDFFRHFE